MSKDFSIESQAIENPAVNSQSLTMHADEATVQISRRRFLGAAANALVLTTSLPLVANKAQAKATNTITPGTRIEAFLQILPNSQVRFFSPFIEGGQGVFTAMAQIVGEELDLEPQKFILEGAPPGADYLLTNGQRFTGGSMSVRMSYSTLRKLGATARHLLMQAGAAEFKAPLSEITTTPGKVRHKPTGKTLSYGELASLAQQLQAPKSVPLRDPKDFRWIGKRVNRIDVLDKSTGQAKFAIDTVVDDMLYAAVVHSPRLGEQPQALANEADVQQMPGVHSIHRLPGAVAVVADRWWRANKAVNALDITWQASAHPAAMPEDFSSSERLTTLEKTTEPKLVLEQTGDTDAAFARADKTLAASYQVPYLVHGQLEPPSAVARWNNDGTLELWLPNQAPELFQADAAKHAGINADKIIIHSPMLGGFFGRHFLYGDASPYPQAITLAKAVGKPIKLVWSREQEFLRDALRPAGVARFKAALDKPGKPLALEADGIGEGPGSRWFGRNPEKADESFLEGIGNKPYGFANHRINDVTVADPAVIGFWRSVGHSMNDFFYESFFDEIADAGGQDPYQLRLQLLKDKPRHKHLLQALAELAGGWQRGPYKAPDGSTRARGVAMASPFGSEVATMAEVSLTGGKAVVHQVWVAIDPGSIVNPAVIEAQVNSAVALGTSITLHEQVVYKNGEPVARNFDRYPILKRAEMPEVHVRIVESGAPMGGIGEPGLPGVPPAIVNAVSVLAGKRIRALPLSQFDLQTQV